MYSRCKRGSGNEVVLNTPSNSFGSWARPLHFFVLRQASVAVSPSLLFDRSEYPQSFQNDSHHHCISILPKLSCPSCFHSQSTTIQHDVYTDTTRRLQGSPEAGTQASGANSDDYNTAQTDQSCHRREPRRQRHRRERVRRGVSDAKGMAGRGRRLEQPMDVEACQPCSRCRRRRRSSTLLRKSL